VLRYAFHLVVERVHLSARGGHRSTVTSRAQVHELLDDREEYLVRLKLEQARVRPVAARVSSGFVSSSLTSLFDPSAVECGSLSGVGVMPYTSRPKSFLVRRSCYMTTVNVYLTFDGDCEAAFNFYKSVFGGEFPYIGRYKDMPAEGGNKAAEKDAEKIMHVSLPISKETMLMGSDTGGEWATNFSRGNNFSISITTDSRAEADRLFSGLSAGGNVTMPMDKTFWGEYFGMFSDKFGINWMVSCNEAQKK